MTTAATAPMRSRTKVLIWTGVAAGLLVFAAANAHLVYVAVMSQPDCIAHVRQGQAQGNVAPGAFSAAKSSCSIR